MRYGDALIVSRRANRDRPIEVSPHHVAFGFLCVSVNHGTRRMPEQHMLMRLSPEGHVMRTGRARLIETLQDMLLELGSGNAFLAETYADRILDDMRLGIINGKDT